MYFFIIFVLKLKFKFANLYRKLILPFLPPLIKSIFNFLNKCVYLNEKISLDINRKTKMS